MNKKATYFTPLTVIAVFIMLITAYAVLSNKLNKQETIGLKQTSLLDAYSRGEFAVIYAEDSGKLSALQSFFDLAFNGGYSRESNCGDYFGFSSWTEETEQGTIECYPSNDELASNLKFYMNYNLPIFLKQYSFEALPIDYEFTVIQNPLKIIGNAVSALKIDVYQKPAGPYKPYYYYVVPTREREIVKKIIETYGDIIRNAADRYKIPASLVAAIIAQESKGNPNAISPTGCAGIAQFCYGTAKDQRFSEIFENKVVLCCPKGIACPAEAKCSIANDNRFNPEKSINAEARYLGIILNDFSDKKNAQSELTIASYNAGESDIRKAIAKTKNDDPSWADVSAQITPDIITSRENAKDKISKVTEVNTYVSRVMSYKAAADELLAAPAEAPRVS